jgi:hypothetical protein
MLMALSSAYSQEQITKKASGAEMPAVPNENCVYFFSTIENVFRLAPSMIVCTSCLGAPRKNSGKP